VRGGALVLLLFSGGAALVLLTDAFDAPDNALTGHLGELTAKTGGGLRKERTLAERVAALDESTTELARRARAVRDVGAALAGTENALEALLARLDELAAAAGRLPRGDVETRLDAIERDFEMRDLMVQGGTELADTGPDEVSRRRVELRDEARALREAVQKRPELVARLDRIDAALAGIEPPKPEAVTEGKALEQARARFHKGVTTLRAKLG